MKRTILLCLLAVVVAACGGGDGDTGDGGGGGDGGGDRDFDRCSLMTAEEAARWLGDPVDEVGPSEGPGSEETCLYESTTNEKIVLIQVYDGEVYFAEEGSAVRGPNTITGLGDDAWSDVDTVAFLQNDFSVSVSRIFGPVSVDQLQEMAELISTQLP